MCFSFIEFSEDCWVCIFIFAIKKYEIFKNRLLFAEPKTPTLLLSLVLLISSCGSDGEIEEEIKAALAADFVTTIEVNPDEIISFEDVKSTYKKGDILKLRVNRSGLIIEEHNIQFDGVYDSNGERLIFCKTISDLVVGQGDSGSPVLNSEGKIIAVLCYGFSDANHQFAARAIEDVLSVEKIEETEVSASKSSFETIDLSFSTLGMTEEDFSAYIENDDKGEFKNYRSSELEFGNKGELSSKSTSNSLISGNSISLCEVRGTVFNWCATGTASFVDEKNIYAFGHSSSIYNGAPVYLAKMVTLIESSYVSYKLSLPTDEYLGVLVADQTEGILIDREAERSVCEIITSIKIGDNEPVIDTHDVAQFEDAYNETYHALNLPRYLLTKYILDRYSYSDYVKATAHVVMDFEVGGVLDLSIDVASYYVGYQAYIIYNEIQLEIYNGNYSGHINSVDYTVVVEPVSGF